MLSTAPVEIIHQPVASEDAKHTSIFAQPQVSYHSRVLHDHQPSVMSVAEGITYTVASAYSARDERE